MAEHGKSHMFYSLGLIPKVIEIVLEI